ncbi:U6 snRNA-associated Sm-like protein LSm1 [Hibiscus syriacus]|uniref:U6 snRNA-associated Sm-like protein LSm1 n=1 Tax=Hibiscus syriacus TaxID=106335 RepID=A0A6A2XII2_HIBSY|nr:U6 snRNA-associated Sm-like protein LSm1 [Hibiscus syriacus]
MFGKYSVMPVSTSHYSIYDAGKLLALLRDGRKLMGTLRSFDQFANAVLEGACERVIVGDLFGDIPLGTEGRKGGNRSERNNEEKNGVP